MDLEDNSKREDSERETTVIQNISTLDLTLYTQSVTDSDIIENSYIRDPVLNKFNEIHDNIIGYKDKFLKVSDNDQVLKGELNERNVKIISVEIDFLKQSVNYLQSQIHSKTLEINSKDEKITKLEKSIDKQKNKLKALKSRVKLQDHKLLQMEQRLPKYHELIEKYKVQEIARVELNEKYTKLEGLVSQLEIKKNKFTSSSPKPKNPASPYRLLSPRVKKTS